MFKKEIVEKDGEQVFKINGMYFKYDTDKVDDTDPEVQERLFEITRHHETCPFFIRKVDGKCHVSEISFGCGIVAGLIYYNGYMFAYDLNDTKPFIDFDCELLDDWINRYRDWVVSIMVVEEENNEWTICSRP